LYFLCESGRCPASDNATLKHKVDYAQKSINMNGQTSLRDRDNARRFSYASAAIDVSWISRHFG
jgi:hypothetical protein